MTRAWYMAVVILGVLVVAPNAQGQTKKVSYAVHELSPATNNASLSVSVRGMNNWGQVGGRVSGEGTRRICIWEPDDQERWIIRDLGISDDYPDAYIQDINDCGHIVGDTVTLQSTSEGFLYDDATGSLEILARPEEGLRPLVNSINNDGSACCGSSRGGDFYTATAWVREESGTWTVINLATPLELHDRISSARDVNDNQQIVGYSNNSAGQDERAHLWERNDDGEWTVTTLSGDSATAINNLGQIAGAHYVNGARYACIWERIGGEWLLITDLSVFASEFTGCDVLDINDLGQVVGRGNVGTGSSVAYLYTNGVMQNLNNYLPSAAQGWYLMGASEVNDFGLVAGYGYNPAGAYRGFLMDTRAVTYSYTSTGSAVAIKDKSTASKSMTLSDNETITDLNVAVKLYHTRYQDLKVELVGPNNVTRALCNAGALTGSGTKTIVFDDDGAAGSVVPAQPLSYYDNTTAQGKWTVRVSDTVRNLRTGSFYSFTLDVVPNLP